MRHVGDRHDEPEISALALAVDGVVTLVTQAASNSKPATRDWSSAWLETSITAWVQPLRTIRDSSDASRSGGGVVWVDSSTIRPSRYPKVPSTPTRWSAAESTPAIRQLVVVLPLVPVTPISFNCRLGHPAKSWHRRANDSRGFGTTHDGTGNSAMGRWASTAAQPRATASAAKSRPSQRLPGSAANNSPSRSCRESLVQPEMWTSSAPMISASGNSRRRLTTCPTLGQTCMAAASLPSTL